MSQHLPAIIIVVPLITAFFITIAGWVNQRYCLPLAVLALGGSLICAVQLVMQVAGGGSARVVR